MLTRLQLKNPYLKKAELAGILYLIKENPGISSSELIRATGLPKETLRSFKVSVANFLESPTGDAITFKPDGLPKDLDLKPYKWTLLEYQDFDLEQKLSTIRKKYKLEPKREYDQFFATIKTSVSKAKVLMDKGMVEDKAIALIGDDDLVSITLALMTDKFGSITVFDIDDDILSSVTKICSDLGIKNVQTVKYDARENISENYTARFDVVMTDPPYTRSGIDLFVRRSLELLGEGYNKYLFLCFGNSFKSPEKTLKIQEVINDYNFLVEDRIDKFNRYFGAESIGSASSLYILKVTPQTYIPEKPVSTTIYTYEKDVEDTFPYVDHYVFKVRNVPSRVVESKKMLTKVFGDFCKLHKLSVVDTKITKFKGKGLTLTYVLSQSNLTVHTWPEYNALHIVLVTCLPIQNKTLMPKTLGKLLKTDSIETVSVE